MPEAFEIYCHFAKVDEDQRLVWGWASIATDQGAEVVDSQGDVIAIAELQRAAHQFIAFYRTGGAMHAKLGVGVVVDSIVLTEALQQTLGIDLGREGWFIGMHVADDEVWAQVKSGQLAAFSIGGTGRRESYEEGAE